MGRIAETRTILDALENGWLQPDGRGGSGEVRRAVTEAGPWVRLFVLIDSDREEPGGGESPSAHRAREECAAAGVPIHVLERREIENYVPAGVWSNLVGRARRPVKHSGVNSRVALVYRGLLRLIERHEESLKKHGRDALTAVRREISRRAERRLPRALAREMFEQWCALSLEEQKVDDLKVRFDRDLAEGAVTCLGEAGRFEPGWLDADARAEFRRIAAQLEEWL